MRSLLKIALKPTFDKDTEIDFVIYSFIEEIPTQVFAET